MSKITIVVTCLLLSVSTAWAERLPGNVVPEHYVLWFAPDLQKEAFRGRETIRVQVKAATPTITLHAAEIEFGDVRVTAGGRSQSAQVTTDASAETATLHFSQPIPVGAASIDITYTGILNDKLRGFYISKANNRKYAVTQMEATDARRAFPSFDEPAFKATFDISLMIDDGDTAISNGRQVSDVRGPEPGKHTVTFSRSPKMSSYLVAMLVGDFVCRDGKESGLPIRVCATPDKLPLTEFALEAAKQQVHFFNTYFAIEYPWEKLDIIGVPDFAAGAMENAGAITFRERMLFADPKRASLDVQKSIASVISHELAHQWFGDLVTMKWWDDIWLNEGFATWMASKPLESWKPDWTMAVDDTTATQNALGLDGLRTTRAIRTQANTPAEINELFDAIAYEKTGAVLRMIENFVGPENMRRAVSSYLRKYSYSNATGEDFWNEVTRVTGKPVDRIMKSLVDQPGAPLLSVTQTCSGTASTVTVTQARFSVMSDAKAVAAPQTWTLPMCLKNSVTGAVSCEVVDKPTQTFTVKGCDPVFANPGAKGYYYTEYSPDIVTRLTTTSDSLAPVERISLLGDEWWMVRSGRHDVNTFMDVARTFANDQNDLVIATVARRLDFIGSYLVPSSGQSEYQAWVRSTFGPALSALGLPGGAKDSEQTQSRRATLLALVGATGNDGGVQRQARELAERYIADRTSLAPTLAPVVLKVAALSGDEALYDKYIAQLAALSKEPEDYYRYFNALASFRDPALTRRTLDFALTPAVRTQDLGLLLGSMLGENWSREVAWSFAKERWSTIIDTLGVFQGLPQVVNGLGAFCSDEAVSDLKQFFDAHPVPTSARWLSQSIERVESCSAVRRRQTAPLTRWLSTAQ